MKKEIEDLKATVKLLYDDNVICGVTAKKFDLAIAALEKQIAIEVDCIDINKMAWLDGYCVCGEHVTDSMNYCIKCGQKLDWSEVEE